MKPENVTCPKCGGRMVRKMNRAKQTSFWGCAKFPECRGTRDSEGEAPRRRSGGLGENQEADIEGPGTAWDGDTGLPSERARRNDRRRWED